MFTFSNIHDYENEPAVKQILVYSTAAQKEAYEKQEPFSYLCVYRIRAVLNSNGNWDSVVRCGMTGRLLIDKIDSGKDWESAMINSISYFIEAIESSNRSLYENIKFNLKKKTQ